MAADGNYVFALPDGVSRRHVTYRTRYGIEISADLYLPADVDESSMPGQAVLVGSPYGAVKEQAAGLWAAQLASRGTIALSYDQSFNGYSGGEPRHASSPDVFVEDVHAAIDYLGTRPFVDRERIGAVGVCASGAFVLTAAQVDPRIKAVVTASVIDISEVEEGEVRGLGEGRDRVVVMARFAPVVLAEFVHRVGGVLAERGAERGHPRARGAEVEVALLGKVREHGAARVGVVVQRPVVRWPTPTGSTRPRSSSSASRR